MQTRTLGALVVTAVALLALCTCGRASDDQIASAEAVLCDYFEALTDGRFQDAAHLYGGDDDPMATMNPDVDPDDHATLLERWCRQNGGVCLPIREIVGRELLEDGSVRFWVRFTSPDGRLFEIGPCCGEPDTGQRTSEFDFVVRPSEGQWKVLQLPPYVP